MEKQILDEIKSILRNKTPKWLSIKDCVSCSGLSDSSIRRAIRSGKLKANKVNNGKWIIKSEWLENYLSS